MKTAAKKNETKQALAYFALRISVESLRELATLANKDSRTVSAYCRLVLEDHVERQRKR